MEIYRMYIWSVTAQTSEPFLRVVIVVESLSHKDVTNGGLTGIDALIVWSSAPNVCRTVDTPRYVERQAVAEHYAREEWGQQTLRPEVAWNQCGDDGVNEHKKLFVVFSLEPDYRVSHQVTHIYVLSLGFYFGMLFDQKPSNVREKEASLSVVRIGICFGVFVMNAMVATPLVYVVLEGHDVEECEDHTQMELGFVCPMRPKTMCARLQSQGLKLSLTNWSVGLQGLVVSIL